MSPNNEELSAQELEQFSKSELIRQIIELRRVVAAYKNSHDNMRVLAKFFMAGTIVSLPFRFRRVLLERPNPPIYQDYTNVLFFISDAFLLATLLFWAIGFIRNPRPFKRGPLLLTLSIAAFTGTGILSIVFSFDATLSIYHAIRLILMFCFYLYIINEVVSLDDVIIPIALQISLQAGIGIIQVLKQHSIGLKWLGELQLDPTLSGVSTLWDGRVLSLRAYGLTDHPNILAGCLSFGLILLATRYLTINTHWRIPMTGIFILGALGLFYTFSRSAWLALSGALLLSLVLYLRQRNRPAILAWISLVATTAIVMLPFLWKDASFIGIRLNWHRSFEQTPREEQSIGERALLNTVASQIFADHPLSGVGLGAFPLAMQRQFPDIPINYQPAHFVLLDVAAEIGIFGAFFYAVAMVTPFVLLWLNRKRQVISLHLVGISSLLLALIIVGMLDYYTWLLEPGRLWQWLAWGLWVVFFQLPFGEAASA